VSVGIIKATDCESASAGEKGEFEGKGGLGNSWNLIIRVGNSEDRYLVIWST
jgi:hypothetical protein